MNQIIINGTNIRVSRIGFGTGSLHHLFGRASRRRLLEAAADSGITHFDTSPYYGYGLAEIELGHLIHGRRSGFTLTTKVGLYPWRFANTHVVGVWTRKALGKLLPKMSLPDVNWQVARARASLDASLQRLGTDYVDFLFLHEPEQELIDKDEMLRWLMGEQTAGRIRAWGIAGTAEKVAPLVKAKSPLSMIVQTKDSLAERQADFMLLFGRSLQFTYGYLSANRAASQEGNPQRIIELALKRNPTGAILVSTRRIERIGFLATAGM